MTIDLTTPMRGPVDMTEDELVAALTGGSYNRAEFAALAHALHTRTGEAGIRTSLIAAQMIHETGHFNFGGQVTASQFNFAGLGATNDGAAGMAFASIDEGVVAVLQHHIAYMLGTTASAEVKRLGWLLVDQRFDLVARGPNGGTVTTIGDYTNGRWAFTRTVPLGSLDNNYARNIVAIAEAISGVETVEVTVQKDFPDESDLGFAVTLEPTDFDNGPRALSDVKWAVIHDTEGHFAGDLSVLTHGSRNGSVHAIIGRAPGQFALSVPIRRSAYTAGNDVLGDAAIQVEFSKAPDEVGYTDYQYAAGAMFYHWAIGQGAAIPLVYYWPHPPDADGGPLPDAPGFIGHFGVPNPIVPGAWGGKWGHTDPGDSFDWPRFMDGIKILAPIVAPKPTQPKDTTLHFPSRIDPYLGGEVVLGGGFRRVWEVIEDRFQILGFPISNEHTYNISDGTAGPVIRSAVCQEFERVTLEYTSDPGLVADRWDVTGLPRHLAARFIK